VQDGAMFDSCFQESNYQSGRPVNVVLAKNSQELMDSKGESLLNLNSNNSLNNMVNMFAPRG